MYISTIVNNLSVMHSTVALLIDIASELRACIDTSDLRLLLIRFTSSSLPVVEVPMERSVAVLSYRVTFRVYS